MEGLVKAKTSLIIGTYNSQDLRIPFRGRITSLSEIIRRLVNKDVKVLICLAPIMRSSQFIQTCRSIQDISENLIIRFCRRMHIKTIVVDLEYAYVGSANLSGAGIGLKSVRKRNFELGFVTRESNIIADVAWMFMEIFNGKFCSKENCHFYQNFHLQEPCYGIFPNT